jgi:hypothetical protein
MLKIAEWIAQLLCDGLLKASFILNRNQRELRELVRYRRSIIEERARQHNRIQFKLGSVVTFAYQQISPGKNAIFLSIYLLHLLPFAFGSKDFGLSRNLIQRMLALYEVRIPQTRDLPPTSFRFHLTMETLVLRYGYYCLHHSGL